MKTTISVPDRLFAAADGLARRLGVTCSRFYATALDEYLARYQAAWVTERLNAVYAAQRSRLDAPLPRAQRRTLERSEW